MNLVFDQINVIDMDTLFTVSWCFARKWIPFDHVGSLIMLFLALNDWVGHVYLKDHGLPSIV